MKVELVLDGKYKLGVNYDTLENIVSSLPDNDASSEILHALASHPSSKVRSSVAYKDCINEQTINLLAKDSSIEVLRNLVRNSTARDLLDFDIVKGIIDKDIECAESIAGYVESWGDTKEIAQYLVKHPDPSVRYSLAYNSGTPKNVLKELAKDNDDYISNAAKENL